eukprot:14658305-Alexandrium_andersonii.AAC.1
MDLNAKPWGLRVNGDLWAAAHQLMKGRGHDAQTIRKVKGHATGGDIASGIISHEDARGNQRADQWAGFEAVRGRRAEARLIAWLNWHHVMFGRLVEDLQRMMVAILEAVAKKG